MNLIESIRVRGLTSLRDMLLEPGDVSVLIGPNGAGKSNVLRALEMLAFMRSGSLQRFLIDHGPASELLHYGPRTTPVLEFRLEFRSADHSGTAAYEARLAHSAGNDTFVYIDETVEWLSDGDDEAMVFSLGAGHRESELDRDFDGVKGTTARHVRWCLQQIGFFHFHDTSHRSDLRSLARESDGRYLRSNGSNLAAFLLSLSEGPAGSMGPNAFRRINHLVRRVVPSVAHLRPTRTHRDMVRLDWEDDRGDLFGPARLSDGALRTIALITALAQPVDTMPKFISIDEPELGLHPAALGILASLIRSASTEAQILIATQSPPLLDLFDAEQVVVVEREHNASVLRRQDPDALKEWLDDYRLSELFDQNLLGGRP